MNLKNIENKELLSKIENTKNPDEATIVENVLNCLKESDHKEYIKKFTEMQAKVGILSEESAKMQDHCFNVLSKYLVPEDFHMGMYYCSTNGPYVDYPKLEKLKKKSKYCLQDLFTKGNITERDIMFVQMGITKESAKKLNENHPLFYEIYNNSKQLLKEIAQLRFKLKRNIKRMKELHFLFRDIWSKDQLTTIYEFGCKLQAEGKFTLEKMFGFQKVNEDLKEEDYFCILDAYFKDDSTSESNYTSI